MTDVVSYKTPVGLWVGEERVGWASLEALVVPDCYVAATHVVDIELDVDLPAGVRVEAHFSSALEGVSYLAAQSPERIGKDS